MLFGYIKMFKKQLSVKFSIKISNLIVISGGFYSKKKKKQKFVSPQLSLVQKISRIKILFLGIFKKSKTKF